MRSSQDGVAELLVVAPDSLESNFEDWSQEFIILDSSRVDDPHAVNWLWITYLTNLCRCSIARVQH